MKTIIIEDEAALALGLSSSLKKIRPDIEIVAVASGVSSAIEAIRCNPDTDLIFADIRLEDGYSFDVFDTIQTDAVIVFTTAYDEYALKAFDYDCIDYLLKPYSEKDLQEAIQRFEKRFIHTTVDDSRRVADALFNSQNNYRTRIELDKVDSTVIADVNDICYAEYDLGNVNVHCKNGIKGTTVLSLTKLMEGLDPKQFMKVSRTHIVNVKQVASILPTLRRNKILTLKEPYSDVRIEVTSEMLHQLKSRMGL